MTLTISSYLLIFLCLDVLKICLFIRNLVVIKYIYTIFSKQLDCLEI